MQIYHVEKPSKEIEDFLQNRGFDEMNDFQKKELIHEWQLINTNPGDEDPRNIHAKWLYDSIIAFLDGISYFQKSPITWCKLTKNEGLYLKPLCLLEGEYRIGVDNHKITHIYSVSPSLPRLSYDLNWMFDKHVDDFDPKEQAPSKSIGPKNS